MEVITQLRGYASESFIRKCLDLKYKDTRRSENASQQNKPNDHKIEGNTEKSTNDYEKSMEQESQTTSDLDNEVDNLALIGAPVQKKEYKKCEENTEQEMMIVTSDGQILVQRGDGNDLAGDKYNNDSSSESLNHVNVASSTREHASAGLVVPQTQEDDDEEEFQVRYQSNVDISCENILQTKDAEIDSLKKRIQELEITNLELRDALDEINQFHTADMLPKNYIDDIKESIDTPTADKEDICEFEEYKTCGEVSEYFELFFKSGNSAGIPFSIKIDFAKRKLISFRLGKLDQ